MEKQRESIPDGTRVSHAEKGLGFVSTDPSELNVIVPPGEQAKAGNDMVYVIWDDDRFPVGKVSVDELELVPPAAEAIS